jgi:integrase
MARYRKKPLAQLEYGTRIYAPTANDRRFRIVTTDPLTRQRVFLTSTSEEQARAKARELELFIAQAAPIREPKESGPRTVGRLAQRYIDEHLPGLSTRFRDKQTYLLRRWVLPHLAERTVTAWTPAESVAVLAAARRAGVSDATVQDIGSVMRALVTHARRLRWLTAQSENPMWMVRYARTATVQGNTALYVPRAALPTDDDCNQLFVAMASLGHARWATAMRLAHRAGLRWGELIALQAGDLSFDPRVVHVRRAVEQPTSGSPTIKLPKNGRVRTSIFPKSLTAELRQLVDRTVAERGADGWLFPAASGRLMRRSSFQQIWIRAADTAGWPMTTPVQRSAGYGEANKGWRWTGAAKWTPHDLRHVAACWMLFDLKLDPAIVADKLGHADPNFTIKRYVGIRGDADQTAMTATEDW